MNKNFRYFYERGGECVDVDAIDAKQALRLLKKDRKIQGTPDVEKLQILENGIWVWVI